MAIETAKRERVAYRRPQNTIEFKDNAEDSIKIHTGRQYRTLFLWLSGTVNIATAAATAVLEDAVQRLVKKITLDVNGNVPIKSLSGRMVFERTALRHRVLPGVTQPGTAVGDHPINLLIELPLWMPEAGLAQDAALLDATDAGGVKNANLIVQWGTIADMFNVGSAVLSWTKLPTIRVESHDVVRRPGDTVPPYAINRERTINKTVKASNEEFTVDLKSGDNRRILDVTVIAREGGVRTNGIINSLEVADENTSRYKNQDEAFQRAYVDLMHEREANRTGVYHLDLAPRNLIGHGAEMAAVSEFLLKMNVTAGAASELEICVHELIGVNQAG